MANRLSLNNLTVLIALFLTFTSKNIVAAETPGGNGKKHQNTDIPNLLFIMTDQQCFDGMSCAGNLNIKTPNMDRHAR